jgi:hypothetical protein
MATSTSRTAGKTGASRPTAPARQAPVRTARKKAAAPVAPQPTRRVKPAGPAAPAKAPGPAPADEPKKVKLVRDSFTLPKVEYGVIAILKTRAARLARPAKKSEIVRAGLKALISMSDADFLACLSSLPPAKPKPAPKG